jgi:hypothetical protein
MRDIQISRPVLIVLVGAILVGGLYMFKSSSGGDAAPPPPTSLASSATGATGGATGGTGGTGPSGETMTAAEKRAEKAKEARKKLVAAAEEAGMPLKVYSPLQDGKIVMIYFYTKGGQDDQHVSQAVDEVDKHRGSEMVTIKEPVTNKSRYDGIAKAAEITQTPGILIMYHDLADTWQGYIDGDSLNARVTRLTGNSN